MENTGFNSVIGEKKLSTKEKMGPATAVFIIFITSILFLRPAINAINSNTEKLKQNKERLESLEKKKDTLKSFQTQDREELLNQQLQLISRYIPTTKPSLQALISLVTLSRNQSLQFSGITLNPGSIKSQKKDDAVSRSTEDGANIQQSLNKFELTFSIIGTKQSMETFVTQLKELAPMMRISKFSTSFINKDDLQRVVTDNENMLLTANLGLEVYYQSMPDKLPAFEQELPLLTEEEKAFLDSLEKYLFATNQIPTVESLGQGGELGNKNPFEKVDLSTVQLD